VDNELHELDELLAKTVQVHAGLLDVPHNWQKLKPLSLIQRFVSLQARFYHL
jgi:hypothetical protein